ncbi:MAG: hypothetical protein OWU84_00240 [Firmicutes bacterium]|nr:hypothetical protein [Bacillota bacterium]
MDVRELDGVQPDSSRTLVVAALSFEAVGCGSRGRVAVTGAGPQKAAAGLQTALRRTRPGRILAIGFCGGLDPRDRVGSCAAPAEVASDAVQGVFPCAPWPGLTQAGRLVSVKAPVATPQAKQALRERCQARWVDMESFAWAQIAHEEGIPFTIVRVISDGAGDKLPHLRDPGSWFGVFSLAVHAFWARRELAAVVRRMLCEP